MPHLWAAEFMHTLYIDVIGIDLSIGSACSVVSEQRW